MISNKLISKRLLESALEDLNVAAKLCPTNGDIRKLMNKVSDEINSRSNCSTLKKKEKQHHSGTLNTKKQQQQQPQSQQQQITSQSTSQPQQQQQTYIIESAPL